MGMPAKDLTGREFGRLTVIERQGSNEKRHALWLCKCQCGNSKVISSQDLLEGNTNSCGCLRKEKSRDLSHTHGMTNTRLYDTWRAMKARCYNPANPNYKYYGGRGITICDEWKNDFPKFHDWAMSHGYAEDLTIDRINNDGNYEPSNCRWATTAEQNKNKRKHYEKRGEIIAV